MIHKVLLRMIRMPEVKVPGYTLMESVELDAKKTAVIIVDMQNDFAHPDGKLFVPTTRDTIEPMKELLKKARDKGVLIIYTMDSHMKDDVEFKIWGEHAIEGTWGWQIIDELKPMENDIIIRKLRYDAFFGTPLDHILRIRGIENLVIVGTVANICVLHTAGSAALLGYKIIIPIDGISALNDFDMYLTLRQVDFLYKGILTKVRNIVFK